MDPEDRAKARAKWPVRRYALGKEPPDDLLESTTAEERLAMVWQLTLEAWSLTGRPLPDLPRSQWPVRIRRLGEDDE